MNLLALELERREEIGRVERTNAFEVMLRVMMMDEYVDIELAPRGGSSEKF